MTTLADNAAAIMRSRGRQLAARRSGDTRSDEIERHVMDRLLDERSAMWRQAITDDIASVRR